MATAGAAPSERVEKLALYRRASNYIAAAMIYLQDNTPARGAAAARAHQAPAARPLGHGPGPQPDLRGAEPADPRHAGQHPAAHRPRPRRAREPREPLDRRLPRGRLPGADARPRRPREADPRLLVAGRLPEPRRADRARHDPRGRRAGLRARHGLRRGARQPGPDRRRDHRRRRGRDGPDRRRLALEQVPRPGDVRRGAADPAPQRLQDRQPDDLQVDERTRS